MKLITISTYQSIKSVWRQLAVGAVCGVFLSLLFLYVAHAHALLVRSIPEAGAELTIAPDSVSMWFSEPLEANFSTAYLVDGMGNEIGRGSAAVDANDPFHMRLSLAELSPGFYTVVWETLSQADGHSWVGSFPLTLLNPDGSLPSGPSVAAAMPGDVQQGEIPTPLAITSRWLGLFGSMLIFGVFFLYTQIHRINRAVADATREHHQITGTTEATPSEFISTVDRAVSTTLLVGVAGVVLGGWLHWLTQGIDLDGFSALLNLIFGTRSGNLVLARQMLVGITLLGSMFVFFPTPMPRAVRALFVFALLYSMGTWVAVGWLGMQQAEPFLLLCSIVGLIGLCAAFFLRRQTRTSPVWPGLQRRMDWFLLFTSALILASFSLGSHAAAVGGSGWAILGDLIHLVAAAIWIGGLVLLALILWQLRAAQSIDIAVPLRRLVARFSAIATLAVFVLAVTGFFSSFVQLRSFEQLWSTTYGWMLLAKLALIGVTLGLALLNHRFVSSTAAKGGLITSERPFLRRVWIEAIVSLVLMVVVAILVQTPVPLPPTTSTVAADTIFQEVLVADDLSIHLVVTPNQLGNNLYQVHLFHEDGSAVGEVQLVRLFFVHQEAELGQASLDLVEQGGDLFSAEGVYQNRSGPWDISVYVRRRGLDDALTETTVTIPEPTEVVAGGPWQNPVPTWPPAAQLVSLLLSIGVGMFVWRRTTHRSSP